LLPKQNNYDQDFKKNAKNQTKVHYLSLETKILVIRHKQHFEFHFEFTPWDGHQMVNIGILIMYSNLNLDYNIS
jgi:hypothetical protein